MKRLHLRWSKLIWGSGLIVSLFFIIFPVYIMFKYSISDRKSIITGGKYPEPFWPFDPNLDMFRALFARDDFIVSGLISLEIALLTVLLSLLLGAPAAFALARANIPGIGVLMFFLISIRLFPDISTVIPIAEIFYSSQFNAVPIIVKVALAHTLLGLPYVIFIAIGVFKTIPKDLEEQAQMMGASKLFTFVRIILPVAAPGLAAAAIYTFLLSWNEFIFSYFLMFQSAEMTLPVFLLRMLTWTPQKNYLAAISLVLSIPVILFTFLVQKYMKTGMTAGAVK